MKFILKILAIFILIISFVNPILASTITSPDRTVSVGASVAPGESDYQFGFSSNLSGVASQNNEIEYTIEYGSLLFNSRSIVLEAEWTLGTIVDQGNQIIEIVSYVPGSATNGYLGVQPTLDLTNRKITWNINSFPAGVKNQTVSFRLVTADNGSYTENITFDVKARLKSGTLILPDETIEQTYLYSPSSSSSTSTSTTTTSTSTPVSSSLPTKETAALSFVSIKPTRIDNNSFSLLVKTNQPATTTIRFGTTRSLGTTVKDLSLVQQKTIEINGLEQGTVYYFKIEAQNSKLEIAAPTEYYIIKTASDSSLGNISFNNFLLAANGIALKEGGLESKDDPILFPINRTVDVFMSFKDATQTPTQAFLQVVNSRVLGINNLDPLPFADKIRLLETGSGIFSGKILTPKEVGDFYLVLEINDLSGGLISEQIGILRISEPIRIVKPDGTGIEAAHFYLERYNDQTGNFEHFPAESYGMKNPIYSEVDGSIDLILSKGKYRAKINAFGFVPQEYVFSFDPSQDMRYPTITAKVSSFPSFANRLIYYGAISKDAISFFNYNSEKLYGSKRVFDLTLFLGILSLSILSLVLTSHRLKRSFETLFVLIENRLRKLLHTNNQGGNLLTGFIEDKESGLPIHGAVIYLISTPKRVIISKTISNILGEFEISIGNEKEYEVIIKRNGYQILDQKLDMIVKQETYFFKLSPHPIFLRPIIVQFLIFITSLFLNTVSNILLFLIVVLQIMFLLRVGLIKSLPLLLITILNLSLLLEFSWREWYTKVASKQT